MARLVPTAFVSLLAVACGDSGGPSTPGRDAAVHDGAPAIDGSGGVSECGDEVCEGLENADNCCQDCACGDGQSCVDDVCTCVARYQVAYSTDLAAEFAPCNGIAETFGARCNTAISRWCSGRGCATTGFGPAEHSGDSADVVCLAAEVVATTFDDLDEFDGACDKDTPYTLACNLAIHRFCAAGGATTGFGTIENSGDLAYVACTSEVELVATTYAELATFHDGCDGAAPGMGDSCNAAISRMCQGRGAIAGFGPVERVGLNLTVACVP